MKRMVPSGSELQSTPRPAPRWAPTVVDMETADAMGWLKRGTDRGWCRWYRRRDWEHCDVPRFRALRRDKTPTPACLDYMQLSVQRCSLSCMCSSYSAPGRAELLHAGGWMGNVLASVTVCAPGLLNPSPWCTLVRLYRRPKGTRE